jgi:hypothetical protein
MKILRFLIAKILVFILGAGLCVNGSAHVKVPQNFDRAVE